MLLICGTHCRGEGGREGGREGGGEERGRRSVHSPSQVPPSLHLTVKTFRFRWEEEEEEEGEEDERKASS